MTVPFLTQALADPAKNQTASNRDATQKAMSEDAPNGDFAALMDNQVTQGARTRPAPSTPGGDAPPTAAGGDSAATADNPDTEIVRGDSPVDDIALAEALPETRRKVIVPELPASPAQGSKASQLVASPADVAAATDQRPAQQTPAPEGAALSARNLPDAMLSAKNPINGSVRQDTLASTAPKTPVIVQVVTQGGQPAPRVTKPETGTGTGTTLSQGVDMAKSPPDVRASDIQTRPADGVHQQPRPTDIVAKTAHVTLAPQNAVSARNREILETRASVQDAREVSARRYDAAPPVAPQTMQAPVPIQMAPQQAMLQPMIQQIGGDKQTQSLHGDPDQETLHFDLRGASSASATQQTGVTPQAMARADLPRSIAAQISDIVRSKPDKPVDVSLNPEELGRVRLSVSTGEGGVVLNILAERPETLELMRRHADMLARELSQLGFGSVDLAFGEGTDPGESQGDPSDSPQPENRGLNLALTDAPDDPQHPVQPRAPHASGGLDIRI